MLKIGQFPTIFFLSNFDKNLIKMLIDDCCKYIFTKHLLCFLIFSSFLQFSKAQSTNQLKIGPYLQTANSNGITIKWRTFNATDSRVNVGTQLGNYTINDSNTTIDTNHLVTITGLLPDTKYFYQFGSSSTTFQGDSDNYFITAPLQNTTRKIRIAVLGDCGRSVAGKQLATLNAYQNYVGKNPAEILLLLGDNAYNNGWDYEYQANFFNVYQTSILKNHALFPAPGNHDYTNLSAHQIDKQIPYYNIFSLPQNGECGGIASGTPSYYAYNWGNIHFISLDSYGKEENSLRLYDTTSPQVNWLKQDLAANTQKWTIVYWHHPPFTKGSHNSDTESELINIRQNLLVILERNGVDMVLCGHSHTYERSYLLNGYYGTEPNFVIPNHTMSSTSGKYDGSSNSCLYKVTSKKENHGTVYVVSGSAGANDGVQSTFPHDALPFALNEAGMFYFEVEDNRLDAKFIQSDGTVKDQFTMMKDVAKTETLVGNQGQSFTLNASWKGNYNWSTGSNNATITVSPANNSVYTCTDAAGCITDTYNIVLNNAALPLKLLQFSSKIQQNYPLIFWKMQEDNVDISYTLEKSIDGVLFKEINRQFSTGKQFGEYSFWDKTETSGVSLYRLTYSTFGQLLFSDVIQLNNTLLREKAPKLYPNPAINEITIDNLIPNIKLQIIVENGTVVYEGISTKDKITINITNLKSANYFLKIFKINEIKTIGFTKK